jgi:hypothetical protein
LNFWLTDHIKSSDQGIADHLWSGCGILGLRPGHGPLLAWR